MLHWYFITSLKVIIFVRLHRFLYFSTLFFRKLCPKELYKFSEQKLVVEDCWNRAMVIFDACVSVLQRLIVRMGPIKSEKRNMRIPFKVFNCKCHSFSPPPKIEEFDRFSTLKFDRSLQNVRITLVKCLSDL